ncbi:MAG: hypothetical protein WB686_01875, partial [Pseudolabrys sp.]
GYPLLVWHPGQAAVDVHHGSPGRAAARKLERPVLDGPRQPDLPAIAARAIELPMDSQHCATSR